MGSARTRPIRHSPCIYFLDLSVNHDCNPSRSVLRPYRDRWPNGQICALVPKPNVNPLAVAKDRQQTVIGRRPSSDICILCNWQLYIGNLPEPGLYRTLTTTRMCREIANQVTRCHLTAPTGLLSRIFRTVTTGNFPRIYSTHQLSLYHSPLHRSQYLKAPTRLSGVFQTRQILGNSPISRVSASLPYISNSQFRVSPRSLHFRISPVY